jgi:hypothetical protein
VPEWKPEIRRCLGDLDLSRHECEELVEELCAHLDDRFEQLLSQGLAQTLATEICFKEVMSLRAERTHFEHAKGATFHMNSRTRTLWLPGFVSVAAASLLMMAIEYMTFFRNWVSVTNQVTYAYIVWLLLLPFCGAAGAMLSRRYDGSLSARLASGLFPSLVMLSVFLLILPFDLLINRNGYVVTHPMVLIQAMAMWVFTPAVVLLAGSAPFCQRKLQVPNENQKLRTYK